MHARKLPGFRFPPATTRLDVSEHLESFDPFRASIGI